jgi:hypothetical protein
MRDQEAGLFFGTGISAFRGSAVPRGIIKAYLVTEYQTANEKPFVLRIGQRSEELAALCQAYAVSTAAVLTAWNPCSEARPHAENEVAQAELILELDGWRYFITQPKAPIQLESGRPSLAASCLAMI